MAINKNHLFEELDGVKCGIVEKEVPAERVLFLRHILEFNGFTVIAVPSPAPKAAAPLVVKSPDAVVTPAPQVPAAPETFTVGVTDYTFNPINAIFGRLLKMPDGQVVTLGFWEQKEQQNNDAEPYYEAAR